MPELVTEDKGFEKPIQLFKHKFKAQEHAGKELELELFQMKNPGRPPVLLLHGGSAQYESFFVPRGSSLAEYLWEKGYEPWLLDWRASFKVTDRLEDADQLEHWRDVLDFDNAAKHDLPGAIATIREARGDNSLAVHIVGHCLGAGVLAQAVADGSVKPPGRVVLLTLGLFYTQPARGKLKSSLDVLDMLWAARKHVVDPRAAVDPDRTRRERGWPEAVDKAYRLLGQEIGPHCNQDAEPDTCFGLCDRISFMFGTPYVEDRLVPEVHGRWVIRFLRGEQEAPVPGDRLNVRKGPEDSSTLIASGVVLEVDWNPDTSWRDREALGRITLGGVKGDLPVDGSSGEYYITVRKPPAKPGEPPNEEAAATYDGLEHVLEPELPNQFGAIPLRMYLQGAQNARRGWAAKFSDVVQRQERRRDARTSPTSAGPSNGQTELISDVALDNFHEFTSVTLITGKDNTLWYRKSIDDMYAWLLKKTNSDCDIIRILLDGYGHQDLLWGRDAKRDVFEIIFDALRDSGLTSSV